MRQSQKKVPSWSATRGLAQKHERANQGQWESARHPLIEARYGVMAYIPDLDALITYPHLVKTFGRLVLLPIPQDTQCRVAARFGKTLWDYSPNAKALIGYEQGNHRGGGYFQVLERVKEWL